MARLIGSVQAECTPKQLAYLEDLIVHLKTKREAMRDNGISRRTVEHWFELDCFKKKYDEMLRRKLSSIEADAIETLQRNLHCGSPSIEVTCAEKILKYSGRFAEKKEVEVSGGLEIVIDYGED